MQRKVSLHYSDVDGMGEGGIVSILEGQLDQLPPLSARVVRLFISSTFSDMIQERNHLMERVYPRMKNYCLEKHRLEFQMIDLRWGLREASQDDHSIIEFCIKEIENCKRLSIGPNFVVLLGQKYGFRSFPSTISAHVFETMRDALLRNGKDVTLLGTWFKKNTNVIPNVYILQPISSILKDYVNKDDKGLQEKAAHEWEKTFQQLLHVLRLGVLLCCEQGRLTQQDKNLFFMSVTEYDIEKGMLESKDPLNSSLCFTRRITNLEENVRQKRAQKFIDLQPGSTVIDRDAQQMLHNLQRDKIRPLLKKTENIKHFNIVWMNPVNSNPNENPEYLKEFCDAFEEKIKELINRSLTKLKNISRNHQAVEILQHLTMCQSRSQVFRGREDIMSKIQQYLIEPANQPLVLYGMSGSGKTSVLAKCASMIKLWFGETAPVVIIRFLGTTSLCCSIRLVLGNICWHISSLFGEDTHMIPGDYPGLVAYFHKILGAATASKPIVIILDSLDQLGPAHRAHNLAWLPKVLPPYVHMILSTLPYEHDLLETLKMFFGDESYFVEVKPLGSSLSNILVREWLTGANRDLTPAQFKIVTQALGKCSLPLYTRLVFQEVSRWTSYAPLDQTYLEPTVKGIINKLFENIERYHGTVFVRNALSYLTASKNGLSDVELEDVLSLDDDVLNDVFQHWLPPIRRIPPLLLPRLHDALSSYVMEREANGIIVFYWYHRQFIFVARDRYLLDIGHRLYIHSTLAHYFMGTWGGGKCKPFKYSPQQLFLMSTKRKDTDQADRKVPLQPLVFGQDSSDPTKLNYNLRKISELPYHLIESKRFVDLRQEVLLNYNWLHAKLEAMSLHDVLSDFRTAIGAGVSDHEVQLVYNALRVGGSYVNQNPDTLAFDLLGRLLVYYSDQHLGIRGLLQQCDTKSLQHSSLLPLFQCFDSPRAMLLFMLEDHPQLVMDLIFTSHELISISKDGTIAFWDLVSGECTRNIVITDVSFGPHTKLYASRDYKYLVVDSDAINSPVYIYDLKTAQLLHTCGRRLATQRRGFLIGNILCRQKNLIDIRSGRTIRSLDDFVTTKRYVTCAISPDENYIMIGEEMVSKLFEFATGKLLAVFAAENFPSTIMIMEDSKRVYVGYYSDCLFKVLDIDRDSRKFGSVISIFNYKLMSNHRYLEGQTQCCELSEIAISPLDEGVVVLNIKRSNLIRYIIDKKEARAFDTKVIFASNKTCFFGVTFNSTGKLVMAGEDQCVHIWNDENMQFLSTIVLHSIAGFPWAVSHTSNQNLIATASTIHTAINVWDLNKIGIKDALDAPVYECPVDTIVSAPEVRIAFVKNYYGLSSAKGYQYLDSFGIDMWNISTGNKETFLPFGRYGKLLKIEVSLDGQHIALLLSTRETYVLIYNVKLGKSVCVIEKPFCQSFNISPDWLYMCTCCVEEGNKSIYMWSIRDGKNVLKFQQAACPVFTYDGKFLLYIDSGQTLVAYCLGKMAPIRFIACQADTLLPLPVKHRLVLATKFQAKTGRILPPAQVSLWDFHESKEVAKLFNVAPGGIRDVSKDGRLAVDGYLRVYNLTNGLLSASFDCDSEEDNDKEFLFVRLTYDGKYAIWVDEFSVKVGRVEDETLIAHTSTHERPTSLEIMDLGYILILGREDGRLLIMKLVVTQNSTYRPSTYALRSEFFIDSEHLHTDGLDMMYCQSPRSIKDGEHFKSTETLRTIMTQRVKKPHAIISTVHNNNQKGSPIVSSQLEKCRHSSSSAPSPETKDLSPIAASLLGAVQTPTCSVFNKGRTSMPSTSSDLFNPEMLNSSDDSSINGNSENGSPTMSPLYGRSKSLQDMLSLSKKSKPFSTKLEKSEENVNIVTASPMLFKNHPRHRGPFNSGSGNILSWMSDIKTTFTLRLHPNSKKKHKSSVSAAALASVVFAGSMDENNDAFSSPKPSNEDVEDIVTSV